MAFQHVGLKITKLQSCAIQIANLKIIHKLLSDNGLTGCNPVQVPYVIDADLSARRPEETQADKKAYQSFVGTLRFIPDKTHPGIAFIVDVLGRH